MLHRTDNETARRAAHRYAPVAEKEFRSGHNRISAHFDDDEKWRRLTGMTRKIEPHLDSEERRAHIERLADWITERVRSEIGKRKSGIGRAGIRGSCATAGLPSSACAGSAWIDPSTSLGGSSLDGEPRHRDHTAGQDGGAAARGSGTHPFSPTQNPELATRNQAAISCTTDWLPSLPHWSVVASAGLSVEALCEELGIARTTLTRLLREYCGLSAGEFIDGLRLRGLKDELLTQLKVAARVLWGRPGYQAELLASGEHPTHTWSLPQKHSKFFQPQPEDWRELNEWRCNINARATALLEKLSSLRSAQDDDAIMNHGGDPEKFDMQILAAKLGLRNQSKLSEACIRVFGKRLARIERILAQEIVRFYIAAEDRTLREIASKQGESSYIARARYLYHGDEDRPPSEPFLDQWSACEAFQKDWLAAMVKEFG